MWCTLTTNLCGAHWHVALDQGSDHMLVLCRQVAPPPCEVNPEMVQEGEGGAVGSVGAAHIELNPA